MRTYLFADFGKGPRVVRGVPAGHAEVGRMVARGNRGDALAENWDKSPAPWWLVECESAEAGRQVIDAASFTESQTIYRKSDGTRAASDGPMPDSYALLGRILASGGAA